MDLINYQENKALIEDYLELKKSSQPMLILSSILFKGLPILSYIFS